MMSNSDLIRAYDGLEKFDGSLDDISLKLSSRHEKIYEDFIVLKQSEYDALKIYLVIDFSGSQISNQIADATQAIKVNAHQIDLLIRVRCPISKIAEEVYRKSLNETGAAYFETQVLPSNHVPLVFGVDLEIEISLVLNTDVKDNYPYPYRKGTWLSQRNFKVVSDRSPTAGFRWLPLTHEKRKELNIHPQSKIYVNHLASIHEVARMQDAAEVWVAEEHLELMKNTPSKILRTYLQSDLVEQVMTLVLMNCLVKMKAENLETRPWEEIDEMPVLKQVLSALSARSRVGDSRTKLDPEEIYVDLHLQPQLVSEYFSDFFESVSNVKAMLKEVETSE